MSDKYNLLLVNQAWFKDEFKKLGHNVVTAGWRGGFDVTFEWCSTLDELYSLLPEDFIPDRIIYFDDSSIPSILDFNNSKCPTVFYSVDIHHHFYWHKYFMSFFSHSYVAQKDYIPDLLTEMKDLISVSWLPLWASQDVKPAETKDIAVSFRGTMDENLHPGRRDFFTKVSTHVEGDFGEGPFPDIYARSKIVLNEAVRGDLNFRVFEAMISGALVVTPEIPNGMNDLFTDKEDLILYKEGDVDEAAHIIKYYLENEEERIRIAESGRIKVFENHSKMARAKQIEKDLIELSTIDKSITIIPSILLISENIKKLYYFIVKNEINSLVGILNKTFANMEFILEKHHDKLFSSKQLDTAIFAIDAVNSDILDEESYSYWLDLLRKCNNLSIAKIIIDNFEMDEETKLKTGFEELRSNFLKELLLN